ncbi:hypothetical protein FRC02_003187 [Tulasnella sp. 418]|nr:hypothetical protein FRC02_003187 [Tulasnella sp. 418]
MTYFLLDMVNPKPFMSKVTNSNGLQPVEWSIAGMNSPKLERFIQESPDGRCRCNNCVDALFGSNLQLGLQLVRDMEAPDLSSRVVTSWIANWTEKKLIFSLTDKLLAAIGENSACDASTHTAPDTSVIGQVENEVTPAQEESSSFCSNHETASANPTFEESTNFVGIPFRDISLGEETDEQSDYEDRDISADDTSFEGSMLSQASQHSQIPGSIDYDTVPSIVQAELEWDLEDIRTDRERWEHDERIKRQREDEDRKQETDRKKRRLVLANEAQTALIEAWRADEDRRRQEERERQDTLMRERFRAKLAEIE